MSKRRKIGNSPADLAILQVVSCFEVLVDYPQLWWKTIIGIIDPQEAEGMSQRCFEEVLVTGLGQGNSSHKLHHNERLAFVIANVVNHANVWVVQ